MEHDTLELDDAIQPGETSYVIIPDRITEAEYPTWENYQETSYTDIHTLKMALMLKMILSSVHYLVNQHLGFNSVHAEYHVR